MLRAPTGKPGRSLRAAPLVLALAVLPAVSATEAVADGAEPQVATLRQLATSVPAVGEVPAPSAAVAEEGASRQPSGDLRIITTSGSRREALRTGVVQLRVSNPRAGTKITLKTAAGRRIVVGRGSATAREGTSVARIRLTTAGRKRLRSERRLKLTVGLRTADGSVIEQPLLLR